MRTLRFVIVAVTLAPAAAVRAEEAGSLANLQQAADLAAALPAGGSPESASRSALDIQRALAGEAGVPTLRGLGAADKKGLPDLRGALAKAGSRLNALRHKVFVPAPNGADREDTWAYKAQQPGRWTGVGLGVLAFMGAVLGATGLPLLFAVPTVAFVLFGARRGMASVQSTTERLFSKAGGLAGKLWDRMAR